MNETTSGGPVKPVDRWLAVAGIAVGIVLFLVPKTTWTVVSLLILVFLLLIQPLWHFWWIEVKPWRKLAATFFFVCALIWLWRISLPEESATAFRIVYRLFLESWGWLTGPHGRWFDRMVGALYAAGALFLLSLLIAVARVIRSKTREKLQKGFLDYKLDAETAISKMPDITNKLTLIMTEVGPALTKQTASLLKANSTSEQMKVIRVTAARLDRYTRRVERIRAQFVENGRMLSEGFTGWFLWVNRVRPNKAQLGGFPDVLRSFVCTMETTNRHTRTYIATIAAMKGASHVLDAAIDRHVRCLESVAEANRNIFDACTGVMQILDGLD